MVSILYVLGVNTSRGLLAPSRDWALCPRFSSPWVPSTACHRVPGTRLACPTLRRVPPSAGTRGSAPEPARSSPCGHRVGAAWAALPGGARHPAQGPVLLRLARPPFGEAACHPMPLLAAPPLAPAGRQRAGVGGSAQHTVAPPRAPGSAQAVSGEGWQAGLGAGCRSLAEPLPQRRPAGLTGGVSGACRPPEARSARPESGALARRDRSCSPPPRTRPLDAALPRPGLRGPLCLQLGREGGPGCHLPGAGDWTSRWAWGTGGRAPSELGLPTAGTARACPSPTPWRPPAEALGACCLALLSDKLSTPSGQPLLSGVTVSQPQL